MALLWSVLAASANAQQVLDDSVGKVGEANAKTAMAAVMSKLKDPMSAQFMSFRHPDPMYAQYPQNVVCGLVNAKNGFGGYGGFSPFAYQVLTKSSIILTPEILSSVAGNLSILAFRSTSCASALGVELPVDQ
ncbi:hypothetical protein [Mesorhizobium australicum]|uniref:hypothetical protein n=1 Tax=Mesorhizobium australicum TaxID=536018 RepID=UPI003335D73C